MRFKVGDKVRVREDLEVDKRYGNEFFVNGMKKHRGEVMEVRKVWNDRYKLRGDDRDWDFTDEMLEPIEDPLVKPVKMISGENLLNENDPIKLPKINREEYELLKSLDDKWKWIARNEDRCLYALTEKPVKKYDPSLYWDTETGEPYAALELFDERHLFQFIQWEDEEPHNIAELIEEYEDYAYTAEHFSNATRKLAKALGDSWNESEETEVKDVEWLKEEIGELPCVDTVFNSDGSSYIDSAVPVMPVYDLINQLDKPEQLKITLQDVTDKLWELPLNNRKFWLARLSDEFQEGYVVPLGLKTTDGEEQYLTYNGSYFASRRNRYLQQTFATLEEIPEFYRELAERVI